MKKQSIFIVGIILLMIVVIVAIIITAYFALDRKTFKLTEIFDRKHISEKELISCLKDDEVASYENDKSDYVGKIKIVVKNKINNKIVSNFQIDNVPLRNAHLIDLRECSLYVLKSFNFDYKASKTLAGFSRELWRYSYNGAGSKILILSGESETGVPDAAGISGKFYTFNYSFDFGVDINERYLVLEKSYLGQDDYALVIKDLNTKQDLLVLNLKDILAKYPDVIPGSFGLGSWTKDGKYLYGDLFQGALSTAYYRIEAETWKTDIFAAPSDILAGVERAINFEKLYLAYVDIPTFTGVQEVYEQIIEKVKKEGKQKNLYLYNLITKEKTKIASAEPEWRYNLEWISDSELQYELPTGEKKIYKLNEK